MQRGVKELKDKLSSPKKEFAKAESHDSNNAQEELISMAKKASKN